MATQKKKTASTQKKASTAKKSRKAAKVEVSEALPTQPDDDQATVGAFVDVVSGDHEGRYGVLVEAHSLDRAIVRTRDANNELLVTAYSDLRPAEAGRR